MGLVGLAGLGLSCGLPESPGPFMEDAVLVRLPETPGAWAGAADIRFRLEWRDTGGIARSVLAGPGEEVEIVLRRGLGQEVLAYPEYIRGCGSRSLRPAGALYPYGLSGRVGGGWEGCRLELGWEEGWIASVSRRLAAGGQDPRAFNLTRLSAELASRGVDPWFIDPAEAARRLAAGNFKASLIVEPERFPVGLPAGGPWLTESALAPSPVAGPGGTWSVALPAGVSILVGPGSSLAIEVGAEGQASIVSLPY